MGLFVEDSLFKNKYVDVTICMVSFESVFVVVVVVVVIVVVGLGVTNTSS